MAESKRIYRVAKIFGSIFILSIFTMILMREVRVRPYEILPCPIGKPCPTPTPPPTILAPGQDDKAEPPSLLIWIPAFTAVMTAIGTISAVILAWRADRRTAREQALKIEQLEHELKELRRKSDSPAPKKEKRKAR
jgi:hypothetical protein